MGWVKISMLLCVFGFLRELEPSESFRTDYLTGPWKNFTSTEVEQQIYPVSTYTYLVASVLVFLLTDLVRYKVVIIISGLAETLTYVLLIVATNILGMQLGLFFFGVFSATEVAYYTYIYAKVDKKHYQEVTSHTRAAYLVGKFLAAVIAQLVTSYNLLDYYELNYISVAAGAAATLWAFFLPSVKETIYFHRSADEQNQRSGISSSNDIALSIPSPIDTQNSKSPQDVHPEIPNKSPSLSTKVKLAIPLLWEHFINAYTNPQVVKWSLWFAVGSCGYLQVFNYVQLLWQTVEEDGTIYNGAVEALCTAIGAAAAFALGKVELHWDLYGEAILTIISLIEGATLIIAALTYNIWIAYSMYILFGAIYHAGITIVSSEVAKPISEDSSGLIFGINTFFGLVLQSLLTITVVESGFKLDIRPQFLVYGGMFIVLAALFLIMAIYTIIRRCRN